MKHRKNCWEFKECGRHEGGEHAHNLGICPAYKEKRLHGIHGGKNAGRACWVIAGTLCKGKIQGTFAQKCDNCEKCNFYQTVRQEEGAKFIQSAIILNKLDG